MSNTRQLFLGFIILLVPLASNGKTDSLPVQQSLTSAATEAEQINDPATRMTAWWRVAAISAEVGNDALCEKAVQHAQDGVPAGNAGAQMFAKALGLRFMILAKAGAGKLQEAEAMVPRPAAGVREDTPTATARLAWIQALARSGDIARAIKEANAVAHPSSIPFGSIATEQAKKGDKAGAVETAKLIIKGGTNPELCQYVAVTLVRYAGADEEARTVATLYEPYQDVMLAEVAKAQVELGRLPEAEKTLSLIREDSRKDPVTEVMAAALIRRGDTEGGKKLAASMTQAGSWETNKLLVEAAIDTGNWDSAAALARDLSPDGDRRLAKLVESARAHKGKDRFDRAQADATAVKTGARRFTAIMEASRASYMAKGNDNLQAWRASLNSPADRAAIDIGATMGGARLEPGDVGAPELMMDLGR